MERHSMKSLRYFAIAIIIANIIGSSLFLAEKRGYYFSLMDSIDIYSIVRFTLFSLIALILGVVLNTTEEIDESDKVKVSDKLRPILYLNIFFITYILVTVLVFKSKILFASSMIMEVSYISIIIYSKRLYISLIREDHRLKWQKAVAGFEGDMKDSNVLWRFKIWFYPIEYLPFKERYFSKMSLIFAIIFTYFCYDFSIQSNFAWIFLLLIIKKYFSLIEYIFGLYTSLIGVCVGIDEFNSNSRNYWVVYVTDFKNKREVVYSTYDMPYISKGSEVRLVHGIFSKYVIKVNNMKIKYRE